MRAAILSIGDELTLGQSLDTNSAWLAVQLGERGILTVEHRTLADDRAAIAAAIANLLARCGVLVITGGLGPTADDLTREALGDAVTPGEALFFDEPVLDHIRRRFEKRGRTMPETNRKQALRPRTMRILRNPNGTAPGLAGAHEGCRIFALPGPPSEMQPMFRDHVLPALSQQPGAALLTAAVHAYGLGESDGAQRLGKLMDRDRHPLVGTTVSDGTLSARIRAAGQRELIQREIDETIAAIETLWHPYVFGRDGATLSDAAGKLLKQRGLHVVTAESCTGGWLGKAIVDRAGSSDYYLGGWVTYSNAMKTACLGVPTALLEQHGAVSAEVAKAMAEGALRAGHSSSFAAFAGEGLGGGADCALSVTGIAGPDGGSAAKPVGSVFIGVATRDGESMNVRTRRFHFPGDRAGIRDRSVKAALQMLRFALLDVEETPLLWELR